MEKEKIPKENMAIKENIRPIDQILSEVKEKGSPDLSNISLTEKETILDWYKNAELTEKDRVDFMEEFMRYSLVDDDTALRFIKDMGEEQKKQLAEYLVRVIKPGKYLQSFYECFTKIDYDTGQKMIESLSTDPEGMLMIAPFKDLRILQTGIKDNYGVISRKNALESEFSSIENAKKLLDALFRYYEEHEDIQGYASKPVRESRFSHQMLNRFYSGPAMNLQDVVNHYFINKPVILFPYLEKLTKLGFLTEDQVKSLFDVRIQYTSDQTKEEDSEIKRLTKKLKGSEEENFYLYSASEVVPQRYALEIEKIRDHGSVRSVESILTNFKEYRKRYGFNHLKFLQELMDKGAPIFSQVEKLGLSKDEIRTLMLRSYREDGEFFNLHGYGDLEHLLKWNREQKEEPDLEKTVTNIFIQSISEYENPNMALHLRDILPWFEKTNRNKIIKAINQRAPHLWLFSLNYAIENQVMPLDKLIARSSERNPDWYLSHFNNLLHHVAILKKEGKDIPIGLDNIRKFARKIILENPHYFLDKKIKNVIDESFTYDERTTFIDDQLKKEPIDKYFFSSLIDQDKEGKYTDACRNILLTNPHIFVYIIESSSIRFNLVKNIFSIGELTDLLIENINLLNFDKTITNNDDLILSFLESPQNLEKLLEAIKFNSSGLIALVKTLDSIKDYPDKSVSNWKFSIETNEKNLKELIYIQNSEFSVEKRELQLKIDKIRLDLKILKENKPIERRTEEIKILAADYREKLKKEIKILCGSEKFLVFHEDIIDILGKDAEDILKRDIEEYVEIHPEVLLREYYGYQNKNKSTKLVFQELLGNDEFSRLFRSKIRTLAFWSDRYGCNINTDKLPEDITTELELKNPILESKAKKHLENDFYQTILAKVRNYGFYSLYSAKLEKIATNEASIYGPRLDTEIFKPNSEFVSLIKTISLLEDSNLAKRNREAILNLELNQRNEFIKIIEFVLYYHLDQDLNFDLRQDNYSEIRQDILKRILNFSKKLFEMEDIEISMEEPVSIDTLNALSVYYNKSCRENPIMKQEFHKVMTQILGGDYKNWRSWGDKEPLLDSSSAEKKLEELKKQGLLPSKLSLDQYNKWLTDDDLSFTETFTYEISDIQSGVRDIFSLAVVDGHIEAETLNIDSFVLANDYQELLKPVRDLSKKQQEYKRIIQSKKTLTEEEKEDYEKIKLDIKKYREEQEFDIKRVEAMRYIDRLRKLSMEELKLKSLFIDKKKVTFVHVFNELETVFSDKPDFLSDIRRIRDLLAEGNKQIFQGSRVSRSRLDLTDKVDLETYVFIGEKPVESCQHYDGYDLNHGLLSYISDPAIKIGQIWDENGNIIARSIFRLMEDENQNPQLFMERVYSVNTHPKIKESMIRFGIQKAKSMGIGAFTQEEEYKELTIDSMDNKDKVVLQSRGSRSPYTYTDAGGGKVPNGIFKIEMYN